MQHRTEALVIVVTLVVLWLVWKLVRWFLRRPLGSEPETMHVKNVWWPREQWREKFLGLSRQGTEAGTVIRISQGPILLVAEEYTDWSSVPLEKKLLIGRAAKARQFDPNDTECRLACSNRVSWLDHKLKSCDDKTEKDELALELKRTLVFIGNQFGNTDARDIAKAALSPRRKRLVDVFYDSGVFIKQSRQKPVFRPPGVGEALEVDCD